MPDPSTKGAYYVGTKRGKVKHVPIPEQFDGVSHSVKVDDVEDANGKQLKPYPIFSMMLNPREDDGHHDLLTGGGDRYVTVWRKGKNAWEVVDQLGPHTGWVKDLASCTMETNSTSTGGETYLFSIGCNCIEVWSSVGGEYRHTHKLRIESSVEMGSTLSSDLLCLATCFDEGAHYLLAGGVDGRIHRWEIQASNNFVNAGGFPAHDGRVNALLVLESLNLLISGGNDGFVHCRAMGDAHPSDWKISSLSLRNNVDKTAAPRKISSLCLVHEEEQRATVAIGTSCGHLALAEIKVESSAVDSSLTDIISLGKGDGNVIHDLCGKRYDDVCRIITGHSSGISVWDIPASQH